MRPAVCRPSVPRAFRSPFPFGEAIVENVISRIDFRRPLRGLAFGTLCAASVAAHADEITVAVAANFRGALEVLASEFEASSADTVTIVSASTGQLYAQIVNGAPYDILLAADQERPRRLAEAGIGDRATLFTYAVGRLVLWSASTDTVDDSTLSRLAETGFRWFAIAEPDIAPYGGAARQVLERLGVWEILAPRLVKGQNVAQTFAMIQTQNAQLGLVALSQALAWEGPASYRIVPAELHDPVRQDAILMTRAADNASAHAFLSFLQSAAAAEVLARFGYAPAR